MTESQVLAARWRTAAGVELGAEILARLTSGRPLTGLGLGEHDTRVDLRALPVPAPRRVSRSQTLGWSVETLGAVVEFTNVQLAGLDLSGAQLTGLRFHRASIVDCRLDGAACRDWRLWATDVTDCSFVSADLRDSAGGTWHDGRCNQWRQVDFTGADLRVRACASALFEDCDFCAANLTGVKFQQCGLVRCTFSGPMRDVLFDGRELPGRSTPKPLVDVDFGRAVFADVEFMGYVLDRVVIPRDPDLRLIRRYRSAVERALAQLADDVSLPARMLRAEFSNRLHMMRAPIEDNVFNRRDYLASGGAQLATLAADLLGWVEAG